MTQREYELLTPALSASTGMSKGSLEVASKDSCGGTSSSWFPGRRNAKSRNESMARDMAQGESKSEGFLVRVRKFARILSKVLEDLYFQRQWSPSL